MVEYVGVFWVIVLFIVWNSLSVFEKIRKKVLVLMKELGYVYDCIVVNLRF